MRKKFKKGAASFYIVAFSTLILVIIAASFAAIIVSEITRTSNDDLAQSAYDSALAGVEDAKLAFYSYQSCLKDSSLENCEQIINWMKNPDCDMVGHILGRVGDEGGEVLIQEETTFGNNMAQAYTCVKLQTSLADYTATLSSSNPTKVVRAKFDGVEARQIDNVKISWFADADGSKYNYTNFGSKGVVFPSLVGTKAATPPTISIGMVQTAGSFSLDQFEITSGDRTNRGMLYLVPTGAKTSASTNIDGNYLGAYDGNRNFINQNGFLKSNNKTTKNLPYAVYCDPNGGSDFACEATIKLPKPVGGERNNDTFIFVVSIPYGKPSTDFALEFFCGDGTVCSTQTVVADDGTVIEEGDTRAYLDGVQVGVDSTGRANDLFRRVEARLEGDSTTDFSMMGAIELLGDGNSTLLEKDYAVTKEYNF